MADAPRRFDVDLDAYVARAQSGPCFICGIVRGDTNFPAQVVYRDEGHIVFFPIFPVLRGYLLVAPITHREGVVGDFSLEQYLALQELLYRVGRAVSMVVPTERLYLLSLGSQQGNRHVHWHVAPLPPGVPYDKQQFAALMVDRTGYLDLPEQELIDLGRRIRASIG